MAPSTRSKAAAATGASPTASRKSVRSPTARKSVRSTKPTRQARQVPEQKPDSSPHSSPPPPSARPDQKTTADPVHEDAFPITRRSARQDSPVASTIDLGSETGLEEHDDPQESQDLGEITILPPPKPKGNRSVLDEAEEESHAVQSATGTNDNSPSELVEMLKDLTPEINRDTFELYKNLILLNNGDQSASRQRVLQVKARSAFLALKTDRAEFIREGELFIDVMRFQALENQADRTFVNNAYHAICTSNLVMLLKYLLDKPLDLEKAQEVINRIAVHFPWVFDFSAPSEDKDEAARQVELAYSLRCCHLASRILHETIEDPWVLAMKVFCTYEVLGDEVVSRQTAKDNLTNGPFKPLTSSPQIPGLPTDEYKARMAVLMKKLGGNRGRAHAWMESEYPAEKLANELADWAESTCEKLFASRSPKVHHKNNMKSASPEHTPHGHQDQNRSSSSSLMVPQSNNESEPESEPDSEAGQSIRRLDIPVDKSSIDTSDDDSEVGEPVIRKGVEIAKSYLNDESDEAESSVLHGTPGGPTSSHAPPISNQQLRNNILGMDPEVFLSSSRPNGSAPPAGSLAAHQDRSNASKRPVPPVEDHADEDPDDDPFETNSLGKNTDRIAARRITTERLPSKRARISGSPAAAAASPIQRKPPVAVSSRPRAQISESSPPAAAVPIQRNHPAYDSSRPRAESPRRPLQPDDLDTLTQKAKANTANIRQHAARKRQVRTAWSNQDRVHLIEDIARYGCSWTTLEKIGESKHRYEVPRNQQQIRDRARNEKVEFLRGKMLLPAGFDDVVLSRKEKELVRGLGLNPYRKEDDVEWVDGIKRPTNVNLSEAEYDSA
ncbi:hypothetical protein PG989_016060 [Apiospora arundinis]